MQHSTAQAVLDAARSKWQEWGEDAVDFHIEQAMLTAGIV